MYPCLHLKKFVSAIIQWREIHQTLIDDVFEAEDEPIRFSRLRRQCQGRYKVRCATLRDLFA